MWVLLLKLPPRQRAILLFPQAQDPGREQGVLGDTTPSQDADNNDLEEHEYIYNSSLGRSNDPAVRLLKLHLKS